MAERDIASKGYMRKNIAVLSLFVGIFSAATLHGEDEPKRIWDLWNSVRISIEDPYQLRYADLERLLSEIKKKDHLATLSWEVIGQSAEGRNLNLLRWGKGRQTVLLWSQMHGDEPTATVALLDILSFLVSHPEDSWGKTLGDQLQLLFLPMLNPDGAERTRRRNAQGIDINRDALALTAPESRALKSVRDRYRPDIGFNLHNQNPRTSVGNTGRPVMISLLAVPYDSFGNDNPGRIRSKKICSLIYRILGPYCYTRISRYDDSFNVRAFGDQMSAWGTSTVLVESGWPGEGGEAFLIRANFLALLSALHALADGSIEEVNPAVYDAMLQNVSDLLFDWILCGATVLSGNKIPSYATDIAINFNERFDTEKRRTKTGSIAEVGDLSVFTAHESFAAGNWVVSPSALEMGPVQGEILLHGQDLFIYRKKNPALGTDRDNLTLIGALRQGIFENLGMR
jgi:hypothetical protein